MMLYILMKDNFPIEAYLSEDKAMKALKNFQEEHDFFYKKLSKFISKMNDWENSNPSPLCLDIDDFYSSWTELYKQQALKEFELLEFPINKCSQEVKNYIMQNSFVASHNHNFKIEKINLIQ